MRSRQRTEETSTWSARGARLEALLRRRADHVCSPRLHGDRVCLDGPPGGRRPERLHAGLAAGHRDPRVVGALRQLPRRLRRGRRAGLQPVRLDDGPGGARPAVARLPDGRRPGLGLGGRQPQRDRHLHPLPHADRLARRPQRPDQHLGADRRRLRGRHLRRLPQDDRPARRSSAARRRRPRPSPPADLDGRRRPTRATSPCSARSGSSTARRRSSTRTTKLPTYYGGGALAELHRDRPPVSTSSTPATAQERAVLRRRRPPRLRTTRATTSRKRFCGTCHDVSNPILANVISAPARRSVRPAAVYFHVERTFSEFMPLGLRADRRRRHQRSPGIATAAKCQDCHMRDVTGKGCNKADAPLRTDLPLHDQTGGNAWMTGILASVVDELEPQYDAYNYAILCGREVPGREDRRRRPAGSGSPTSSWPASSARCSQLQQAATVQTVSARPPTRSRCACATTPATS